MVNNDLKEISFGFDGDLDREGYPKDFNGRSFMSREREMLECKGVLAACNLACLTFPFV